MRALPLLFCCQYITIDLSNEDPGNKDSFNLGEGRLQDSDANQPAELYDEMLANKNTVFVLLII